jgi:hypothetical protein
LKASEELERLRVVIENAIERKRAIVRERSAAVVSATMTKETKLAARAAESATFAEGEAHGLIYAEQILRMARLSAEYAERTEAALASTQIEPTDAEKEIAELRISPSAKTLGGEPIENAIKRNMPVVS